MATIYNYYCLASYNHLWVSQLGSECFQWMDYTRPQSFVSPALKLQPPKYMYTLILHIQAKIKAYKTDYHVRFYCNVTLLVNGVDASSILLLSWLWLGYKDGTLACLDLYIFVLYTYTCRWVANLAAWLYILLLPFTACIPFCIPVTSSLLKVVQWPGTCGKNIKSGSKGC